MIVGFKKHFKRPFLIILLALIAQGAWSQEKQSIFRDSIDNAIDLSHYLYNLHGLLPVISPITEPALGFGAAGMLVYFIADKDAPKDRFSMPDIVMGFGGYTSNDTWFAGGAYMGFWKKDQLRYRGVAGYGDIHIDYYLPPGSILEGKAIPINMNSTFFLQQAIYRINNSNFFLGGNFQYSKTTLVKFNDSPLSDLFPDAAVQTQSGVSIIGEFDNRDNILSPTDGITFQLSYKQNAKWLGSDRDFGKMSFYTHAYTPVSKTWVPAFRFESQIATKETPFYALPFVSLRGVPAMRYNGELTLLFETEHAINITPRWGVVGFAGIGTAFNTLEDMNAGETAWNVGTGFRYLIARQLGLKMGLDVAKGPEDVAFYIVFGSSWAR
jgi:Omp85 superfamily domain